MLLALALIVPIVPGLVWLWIVYRADVDEPEPKRFVAATFLLGVVATGPAWLVEKGVGLAYPFMDRVDAAAAGRAAGTFLPILAVCFLVIGPAEELCKFLAVRLYMFRHREFDEPLDGVIYASAAALGFGSFENLLYVVDFSHGPHVAWVPLLERSLMALPGHVLFSATWGTALGYRKFDPAHPVRRWLVAAAALHGLYDFLLMYPPAQPLLLPFMAAMAPLLLRRIRILRSISPFAPGGSRSGAPAASAPPC